MYDCDFRYPSTKDLQLQYIEYRLRLLRYFSLKTSSSDAAQQSSISDNAICFIMSGPKLGPDFLLGGPELVLVCTLVTECCVWINSPSKSAVNQADCRLRFFLAHPFIRVSFEDLKLFYKYQHLDDL